MLGPTDAVAAPFMGSSRVILTEASSVVRVVDHAAKTPSPPPPQISEGVRTVPRDVPHGTHANQYFVTFTTCPAIESFCEQSPLQLCFTIRPLVNTCAKQTMKLMRRGTELGLQDASLKHLCNNWTEDERNWLIQMHLAARTPYGRAWAQSGIAAFYHSTARFVRWLAQIDAPKIWISSAQKLDQPGTWTASNLVAHGRTHSLLLQEFNRVESAQDPPADPAAGNDVDERDGDGPQPAARLPLPPLNKLASQQVGR